MSAAELARRAGLSKATLSMLEAGDGNPTIGTLDALAVALGIPLTDLVDYTADRGDVYIPRQELAPAELQHELLNRIPVASTMEVWKLHMPTGDTFDGVPHAAGTIESLYVIDGELTVTTQQESYLLLQGDFLSFNGQQTHRYVTETSPADVLVLLASP